MVPVEGIPSLVFRALGSVPCLNATYKAHCFFCPQVQVAEKVL